MKSLCLRATQTPVATASWPIERCMVPCIRPLAKSPSTASSKNLIAKSDSSAAWDAARSSETAPWAGGISGVIVAIETFTYVLRGERM